MADAKPLTARIHTLCQLQLETLDLIRKLRFQLQRQAHEPGMSDQEFLDQIVQPIEDKIYADREMAKMKRRERGVRCTFCAGVGCVNGGDCPKCGGSGRLSV